MSNFDFSQPSRQSAKGIIVIFGFQLFKFFKSTFLLLIPVFLRVKNSGSVYGLSTIQVVLIIFGILLIILIVSILKYLNFKFILTLPILVLFIFNNKTNKHGIIESLSGYPTNHKLISIIENRHGILTTSKSAYDTESSLITYGGNIFDGSNNTDLLKNDNGIDRAFLASILVDDPQKILFIGIGSGSWIKVISELTDAESIDVVELNSGYLELLNQDIKMISILNDKRINMHIDDGRRWIKNNINNK